MKTALLNHARNLRGWTSKKKLVAFAVDDYGNVRLSSPAARNALQATGMKSTSRFDAFDALETKDDLEMLCDTLQSVRDSAGNGAVFTAYALPANIDFDSVSANGFQSFQFESLHQTFEKEAALQPRAYAGAWQLWQHAMQQVLIVPEYHGREHVNVAWLNRQLQKKHPLLLTALQHRSYAGMQAVANSNVGPYAAFEYCDATELATHKTIITEGIKLFGQVFGRKPVAFTPPNYNIDASQYPVLHSAGLKTIDLPFVRRHRSSMQWNYCGKRMPQSLHGLVRNVVFEPTEKGNINWVNLAMRQIAASFFWGKPAIISSHRVNFCGHIDEANRKAGLGALKILLKRIVQQWPDVRFVSVDQLQKTMGI